jgi:hypothetical protein
MWNTSGKFPYTGIHDALSQMFSSLGIRPSEATFYTKGLQKVKFFEEFVPEVLNLEDLGCPKYCDLSPLPQTTLRKAITFGEWLSSSQTSSPQPASDAN